MSGRSERGGDDLDEAAAASAVGATGATVPGARAHIERTPAGRPRWLLFGGLAVGVLVADQLTKAWIAANVAPSRPIAIVGDYLRLVFSPNTGGLFGLFQNLAPVLALASMAVIGLILWYHARSGRSTLVSTALGLLLGGALGNLVDRLRLGYVLDFVDAGIGALRWYTFNVADAAISCSLLLLVFIALRPAAGERPARDPASRA